MTLDIQYRINTSPELKRFLRENSYWYKELNRNPSSFSSLILEMKDKYKLNPSDKINKFINNITLIQNFLDVLK